MLTPNKYSALQRLQLFKPVSTIGTLRSALMEEALLSGKAIDEVSLEQIMEFASQIGFKKCENDDCDLWYNARKDWFMKHEGIKICRMCAMNEGLEIDF